MRLRRVLLADGASALAIRDPIAERWVPIAQALAAIGEELDIAPSLGVQPPAEDLIALLAGGETVRAQLEGLCEATRRRGVTIECREAPLLPFQPLLLRAFASSERHWVQSARGHVARNMPRAMPLIAAYERLLRRPFPPFRPRRLFYEQPSYYIGNALTVLPDGAQAPWPAYTRALDFEIELGAIVVASVRDATPAQARAAIGGFLVVNDLSARDTQWQEVRHGIFGPLAKTKTFASTISAEVVSADQIIDRARSLRAEVRVNGERWSETDTSDQRWSFEEMLAFASRGESVHAGELLCSGTLHDGCSLEIGRWLAPGDLLELTIEGVGTLRNRIGEPA